MAMENWSEHVVLVSLLGEPQTDEDLADLVDCVSHRSDCDVVVDCSQVDRIGWAGCRQLLELDDRLRSQGHRLVLCGAGSGLGQARTAPALAHTLRFADDRFSALARLRLSH